MRNRSGPRIRSLGPAKGHHRFGDVRAPHLSADLGAGLRPARGKERIETRGGVPETRLRSREAPKAGAAADHRRRVRPSAERPHTTRRAAWRSDGGGAKLFPISAPRRRA
jgi:hypothetical protein